MKIPWRTPDVLAAVGAVIVLTALVGALATLPGCQLLDNPKIWKQAEEGAKKLRERAEKKKRQAEAAPVDSRVGSRAIIGEGMLYFSKKKKLRAHERWVKEEEESRLGGRAYCPAGNCEHIGRPRAECAVDHVPPGPR